MALCVIKLNVSVKSVDQISLRTWTRRVLDNHKITGFVFPSVYLQNTFQALVELGDHLSKSKVKAEELRYNVDMTKENKWVADKETVSCQQCNKNFSVSRRRVRSCHFLLIEALLFTKMYSI